jgi:hypothetical protein
MPTLRLLHAYFACNFFLLMSPYSSLNSLCSLVQSVIEFIKSLERLYHLKMYAKSKKAQKAHPCFPDVGKAGKSMIQSPPRFEAAAEAVITNFPSQNHWNLAIIQDGQTQLKARASSQTQREDNKRYIVYLEQVVRLSSS